MTEDTENLILRLLRDIRADLGDTKVSVQRLGERMTTLDSKMDDVNESVGYALGLSAHANIAYETTGQRLTETVADLKARIEALEQNP